MYRFVLVVVVSLVLVSAVQAQGWDRFTNPTVSVKLNHPPGLGMKVGKVAFGPSSGECSDQIIAALIDDFVSNNIEVIDRQHLNAILSEHDFTLSGYVDQTSASAIGKIIGPSALVFVRTLRCATQQDRLRDSETRYNSQTKQNYTVPIFYARTRAFLKASIQTVDLATGRIFSARSLEYSPEQKNRSEQGFPEAPAEFDVLDIAIRAAVYDVHRMFLPWSETRSLVYFDDKDCGLKEAFQLLKSGDLEGVKRQSEANLEACKALPKVKPKVLGHAYYNVGMSYMMEDDYESAVTHFREAAKLRPGEIVNEAIANCQQAQELAEAMQKVEERSEIAAEQRKAETENKQDADRAATLTNEDVMKMVKSNLGEVLILAKIKSSKCAFDTSGDALINLKEAGVSDQIIMAMMDMKPE